MRQTGAEARASRVNPYEDVQVDLTQLCFHRLLPTILGGGIAVITVSVTLAVYCHSLWFWQVLGVLMPLWLLRIAVVLRFPMDKIATMTPAEALRWETRYNLVTVLYLTASGTVTASTFHRGGNVGLGLCTLGTFAFCNGISARLSVRPWAAKLGGSILMVGLAGSLIGSEEFIIRCSVLLLGIYAYLYFDSIDTKYEVLLEQLRLRRKMSDLAAHDVLTGLANRREFCTRLAEACLEVEPFALLYMDLDGFKKVNDTLGHAIGDALLQQVALRLKAAVPGALVARLGGDEFALLHRPAGDLPVEEAARRVNEAIATPFPINGHSVKVGTSIGIQVSEPGHADPDTLLSKADAALYQVKRGGGGSFRFTDPSAAPPKAQVVAAVPVERTDASGRGQDGDYRLGKFFAGVGEQQANLPHLGIL